MAVLVVNIFEGHDRGVFLRQIRGPALKLTRVKTRRVEKSRQPAVSICTTFNNTNFEDILPFQSIKMATTTQMRIRGRPAHTIGPTFLSYTQDGTRLVTVGSDNFYRVYKTGSDGEPTNIDDCPEQNMGVASAVRNFLPKSETSANLFRRMTSSSPALKMERSANTPSTLCSSTNSLCDALSQFEM